MQRICKIESLDYMTSRKALSFRINKGLLVNYGIVTLQSSLLFSREHLIYPGNFVDAIDDGIYLLHFVAKVVEKYPSLLP